MWKPEPPTTNNNNQAKRLFFNQMFAPRHKGSGTPTGVRRPDTTHMNTCTHTHVQMPHS